MQAQRVVELVRITHYSMCSEVLFDFYAGPETPHCRGA